MDKSKVLFSSFTYREAFKHLGIAELKRWELLAEPVPVSDFFRQRLDRLDKLYPGDSTDKLLDRDKTISILINLEIQHPE